MSHLTYKVRMRQYFEMKKQHMAKTTPTRNMSDYETEENYGRSFGGQYHNNNKEQLKSTNNDGGDEEWDDGETTTPAQVLTRTIQKHGPFLTMKIPNTYDMNVALKFSQEVLPKLANAPFIDVVCIHKYFLKVYEHHLNMFENKQHDCSESEAAVTHACDAYFKEIIKFTEPTTDCVQSKVCFRASQPSVKSLLQKSVEPATVAIPRIVNAHSRVRVFPPRRNMIIVAASPPLRKLKIERVHNIHTLSETLFANLHNMSYTAMEKLDINLLTSTSNKKDNMSGSVDVLREKNLPAASLDSIGGTLSKNETSKENSKRTFISFENQRSVNITEQSRPQLQAIPEAEVTIVEPPLVPNVEEAALLSMMEASISVPTLEPSLVPNEGEATIISMMDATLVPNEAATSMPTKETTLVPNEREAALLTMMEPPSTPNKAAASVPVTEPALQTMMEPEPALVPNETAVKAPTVPIIERDWFEVLRDRNMAINYQTNDVKSKKKRPRKVKKTVPVEAEVPAVDTSRNLQHELARQAAMEHPLCGFLLPDYDAQLPPPEPVKDNATFVINTSDPQITMEALSKTAEENISTHLVETSLPMPAADNNSFVDAVPSALKAFIMPAIETVTITEPEKAASKYTQFVLKNAENIAFIEANIDRWHSIMAGYDPNRLYSYYDINELLARDPHKTEIEYQLIQEIIRRPYFDIKRCSFVKTEQDVIIANNFCEDLARADIIHLSESGIVSLKTT